MGATENLQPRHIVCEINQRKMSECELQVNMKSVRFFRENGRILLCVAIAPHAGARIETNDEEHKPTRKNGAP